MKRVKFSIEEAKEIGFDEIEKKALKMLKEGFRLMGINWCLFLKSMNKAL